MSALTSSVHRSDRSTDAEEAYIYKGEYFFGDDILVAPVTEAAINGQSSKEIWFPEGKWWSVATNELIEGPCVRTINFGINEIPYFFKAGAMIPFYPESVRNVTDKPEEIILNVVAGSNGSGSLYEDNGDNSDYAKVFATTAFSHFASENKETLVIFPRKGFVDGLPLARRWTLNILNAAAPKSVTVNGRTIDKSLWSYDAVAKRLVVNVEKTDCQRKIKIKVTGEE